MPSHATPEHAGSPLSSGASTASPPRASSRLGLRKRLPPRPWITSEGLGWPEGVAAEWYRSLPPPTVRCAAEARHRLVLLLNPTPGATTGRGETGPERPADPRRGGRTRRCSVVPAGREQQLRWRHGALDVLIVFLSPQFVGGVAREMELDPALVGLLDRADQEDGATALLAGELAAEMRRDGPGGRYAARVLACSLCAALLRGGAAPAETGSALPAAAAARCRRREVMLSPAAVARATRAMERAMDEERHGTDVRVEDLAAAAGCSVAHFARGFKAATGHPPHDYLLRLRVRRAESLLRGRAGLPLAAVAVDAGFSSQSHMTLCFRRVLGLTPAALRRGVAAAGGPAALLASLALPLTALLDGCALPALWC